MEKKYFYDLMRLFKEYDNTFTEIYKLKSEDDQAINNIYNNIKTNLIQPNTFSPAEILSVITTASIYNNRFMRSYYTLYKMIYEEFHPDIFKEGPNPLNYFLCKELNIPVLDLKIKGKFDKYESKNYSLEIHEPNSIFRAIMENDKETFIGLASNDGFDPKMTLKSDLYPDEGDRFSLIDLCCYHGAVDCFKFLRTEFNSFIGPECLWHSFLGGNQEIMQECLKEYDPDYESMKHAIISHNLDFITYLANEYELEIQLFYCGIYNNLQAFAIFLDQTKDLNECLLGSIEFNLPQLCEYLVNEGADINYKDDDGQTALYIAAFDNKKDVLETLITLGGDINVRDIQQRTPVFMTALHNRKEALKVLVMHGANLSLLSDEGKSPLAIAAEENHHEIVEYLVTHGANVNERCSEGKTALFFASDNNSRESAEVLLAHGAEINVKDKFGWTPLHQAAFQDKKEIMQLLISHGIDVNAKDVDGKTALKLAMEEDNTEAAELLLAHGANPNI